MGFFSKLFGGKDAPRSPQHGAEAAQGHADSLSPPLPSPAGFVGGAVRTSFDQAIDEVYASFDAVLTAAVLASQPLLADVSQSYSQLAQAWSAIEHQKRRHADEISDRWDQYLEAHSDDDDSDDDDDAHVEQRHRALEAEGQKRDTAHVELEIRYHRAHREVMALAGERLRIWAMAQPGPATSCGACGAPLPATPMSQAVDLHCAGCGARQQLEPGDARRRFSAQGAPAIADWAAHSAWEAMARAEGQIRAYRHARDVPMPLLLSYDAASRAHIQTKFETEARLVPELAPFTAAKIDSHLHATHKLLREHPQWRAHLNQGNA